MDLPTKKWQTGETPGRKIPKLPAFYPLKWAWNLNHNIWLSRSCTISCHPPENPCQLSGKMTGVPFFGHFKSEAKLLSIFWGHPKNTHFALGIFSQLFCFFSGKIVPWKKRWQTELLGCNFAKPPKHNCELSIFGSWKNLLVPEISTPRLWSWEITKKG